MKPNPTTVVFQSQSNPKIHKEEELIRQEAQRRGIPIRELLLTKISNRISEDVLPVGTLPFMEAAFSASSVKLPANAGYPSSLKRWLYRRIWESTWGELQEAFRSRKRRKPVFIKPAEISKLFRGRVVYSDLDMARLPYGKEMKIWCSDMVMWRVEWRCYVVDGNLRGAQCYRSNGKLQQGTEPSGIQLNLTKITRIVEAIT